MGEVFLAEHVQLERRVALKLLRLDRLGDARYVERFTREARLVNRIRHPNVVEVTDLGHVGGKRPYVVMEYVEGRDLYGLWDDVCGLDAVRFLDVMIQVADALAAAHRVSVVHRDLKPSNIFLTDRAGVSDFVKLVDFGLGKRLAEHDDEQLTATGEVLATPPYMSPEQATGEPLDGRSDLYSLGVIMWEILVGRRPFVAKSFGEYVLRHTTHQAEPPSQTRQSMLPGGIPIELDPIVLACMAKKPEDRPASAEALRDELARLRARLRSPALVTRAEPDPWERRIRYARYAAIAAAGLFVGALLPMPRRRSADRTAPAVVASQPVMPGTAIAPSPVESIELLRTTAAPAPELVPPAVRQVTPKKPGARTRQWVLRGKGARERDPLDGRALRDPFLSGD
jgi:serine/threonine-protein kinase